MSAFAIAGPLFAKIDSATAIFVTDYSSNAIAIATPAVVIGLTVTFMVIGTLVILGAIQQPIATFLKRSLFSAIIVGFALSNGFYQTEIASVITKAPDEFATSLLSGPAAAGSAATVIDVAAEKGFAYSAKAFELGTFFSQDGIVLIIFGTLMICATVVLCSIGVCFILLSKVALALLAALGPIFICGLLFNWSRGLVDRWLGQILNYTLLVVLFSAVFGFLLAMFSTFMGDANFNTGQNATLSIGAGLIVAVSSVLILWQIPSIASGLAGGVSLGFWHESRQLGSVARGTARLGGSLNSTVNRVRNAGAGGSAARGAGGGSAAGGARAVAGLYKGGRG